jgi:hypothetical protein
LRKQLIMFIFYSEHDAHFVYILGKIYNKVQSQFIYSILN